MSLLEMWRKKMLAMKARERITTTKGSLWRYEEQADKRRRREGKERKVSFGQRSELALLPFPPSLPRSLHTPRPLLPSRG